MLYVGYCAVVCWLYCNACVYTPYTVHFSMEEQTLAEYLKLKQINQSINQSSAASIVSTED